MFDFSNLPVPMWQYILSQVFGLFLLIFIVAAMQMKKKTWLLLLLAAGNVMAAIMQALLTNYIMAGMAALVVIRLIVYVWLQENRKSIPLWVDISILVVFLAANVPVAIFTAKWWFDWVFFGFVTLVTFCQWLKNPHIVRISPIPITIMVLIAAVFYSNFMSLITETFALISVTIFYIRFFRSRKNQANSLDNTSS